jgi:alginate O-acetyltransferase complex protein AlgI
MQFNSSVFALFFVVLLALYGAIRNAGARKSLLLVASYLFYAQWDWRYLSLLVLSTGVDYVAGARMQVSTEQWRRKLWLLASLLTNLGVLATFKYGNFLLGSLTPVWESLGIDVPLLPTEIPVGISFYTFQTLSYTIDIYRRKTQPTKSLLDFALFVSFFPQLVAGPIVRSTEFLPQLKSMQDLRAERVASGLQRFLLGLFKKVVIADNVALFVDNVFASPGDHGALTLWCGAWGFALQIYCDFSAYTDMALGAARAFGLNLPENFNAPYLSRSITEFWRRWHMSLSSWLRDYLYIPLGGSRLSALKTYRNLMATMLLGGLWHGPSWTFVLWGGLHGLFLALERLVKVKVEPDAARAWTPGAVLRWLFTFQLVTLTWVVFRASDFAELGIYLERMLTAWDGPNHGAQMGLRWAGVLALLCVGQWLTQRFEWRSKVWDRSPALLQGAVLALILLLVSAFQTEGVAFLYFQF